MPDDFDDLPDPGDGDGFLTAAAAAIEWLRDKLVMSDEEFYALTDKARSRAFAVSGVADLDVVSQVWGEIDRAVDGGESYQDFAMRVTEVLADAWGGEDPARLETIFRTNVQSTYSAGRWYQNSLPAVRASHPYSQFVAVLDSRTTDICEGLHGTVLRSDDPFWSTHQPPLHFACRSDIVPLTEDEANEEGVDEKAPDGDADVGFGAADDEWVPDVSSRPPELASLYELKLLE